MKGDIIHLLNRGVEKRKIFIDEEDYLRFINNLYDFNNIDNVTLPYQWRRKLLINEKSEEELVNILCWCLMPSHHHILSQEKIDSGVSNFSKKIMVGHTRYFNDKNKRSGVLFQGRSKIIKVTKDVHFDFLPFYIMSNPVKLIEPRWKEEGIKDFEKVINFLENYKYSSFLDLIGEDNYPQLINKELFYELFNTNENKFKKEFIDWLASYQFGGNLEVRPPKQVL